LATSGSYLFNPTADDLLTEAWERLGKLPAEITGDVARAARRSLQYMQVAWANAGLNLWQVAQSTLRTTKGTAAYTLSATTVDLLDVYVTVNGVDRLLAPISRSDYAAIPAKAQAGSPTQYWVNRQNGGPVLTFYPTPDAAYTVSYYRIRQPQDVAGLGQTLDAPLQWADALAAGLAARLAVKFAPDRVQALEAAAQAAGLAAAAQDRNRLPLKLTIRRGRR
jgi:hypothetical protein